MSLKQLYLWNELPEPYFTSEDIPKSKFGKLAKSEDWQIYTQVEGEDGEVYYEKGCHFVNRTGVYAVVRKDDKTKLEKYEKNEKSWHMCVRGISQVYLWEYE